MFKSIDKWFPGYVSSVLHRPRTWPRPSHLLFCLADHFEPVRRHFDRETRRDKNGQEPVGKMRGIVRRWVDEYPRLLGAFRDADGRGPRHTFFYPQEEYDRECLDLLTDFCSGGHGEVEIHLHHRDDTADGFRRKLVEFRDLLRTTHGLLGDDAQGHVRFGFIHGNWALCNSRPDGDWCGVDEELGILRDTGCYADFTFPSAPSPTQPRMVNAIYRAVDRPGRPRGCDRGEPVSEVRSQRSEDRKEIAAQHSASGIRHSSLMLITGPLTLDWQRRKWGVFPRIENGAITAANPPTTGRADLWARQQIHVRGRPEWVFMKVYAHGCAGENINVLLGDGMRGLHDYLVSKYNDGRAWRLHYVTAREMYNIVRAAEDGKAGDPGDYRDYEIRPPGN